MPYCNFQEIIQQTKRDWGLYFVQSRQGNYFFCTSMVFLLQSRCHVFSLRHCASVFPGETQLTILLTIESSFQTPFLMHSGQGILSVLHCVSFFPFFPFNSPSIESLAQNVQFYGFIVFGILHGGPAQPLSEYLLKRMTFEKLQQSKMLRQENIQRCIS